MVVDYVIDRFFRGVAVRILFVQYAVRRHNIIIFLNDFAYSLFHSGHSETKKVNEKVMLV